MTSKIKPGFKMKPDAVYFVPLGGCGIFGMNMSLYGHNGKWIMVDCGMGFADDSMPGVDILLPDPSFAASLGTDLLAIIITHGHEDHIGALQHLWPRLKAPVYATPFTAERIRQDFSEMPWGGQAKLHVMPPRERLELGDFSVEMIKMTHSTPEGRALAITVKNVGTILHSGDWKLDPDPVEGDVTDEAALKKLGDQGILALIGESTNAFVPGFSGSERGLIDNIAEIFGEFKNSAIVITCFSTHIGRLRGIYEAAKRNERHVCLVGRSLWQADDAARKTGYLKDVPPFLESEQADVYPAEHVVYICTGSQGEPRAALSRISNDDHPALELVEGDAVLFSSRVIPGNERAIDRIKNRFLQKGVSVITGHDAPIHVSGHPCREDIKQLLGWTRPKILIPVHGEQMQMEKHAELARECGVQSTLIPFDGKVIEITPAGAAIIGAVDSGVLAIEGKRIVAFDHEAILARRRIMWNGSAVVTAVVDRDGLFVAPPKVTALGLLDENSELDSVYMTEVIAEINAAVKNMPKQDRKDDNLLSELIRVTARRYFTEKFDRKPQTRVHLVRI